MGGQVSKWWRPPQIPVVIISGFHEVPDSWTGGVGLVRMNYGDGMIAVIGGPDTNGDFEPTLQDQVIGFASMERTSDTHTRAYIINNIVVKPEFRRRTIGTNLVKALIMKAERDGGDVMFMNTDDPATGNLLKKCGFEEVMRSSYRLKLAKLILEIEVLNQ